MEKNTDKRRSLIAKLCSVMRVLVIMAAGAAFTLVAGGIMFLNNQPDLSIWHTVELDSEFTADSGVKRFSEYLALEDRLFTQLDDEVYAHILPEEKFAINRYNSGSLSDPSRWPTNWNRTFELTAIEPGAGVLLLHGLSDSPYSLRQLGRRISASGAHVLGLRIPGHGTVPSGLVNVQWEDMAAAVTLAMHHLKSKIGDRPLYIVGYSHGGALAVQYILTTLEDASLPRPAGVVLISPEIGISKVAALAVWQSRIGWVLGMPNLAWNSVETEYDPFKYNSFAVNAGYQAHRLTAEIQNQITRHEKSGNLSELPPIIAFQSVVDATVRTSALIEGLFDRLPRKDNEMVLFDINRFAGKDPLINSDPRDAIAALLDRPKLPYRLSWVSNENASSRKVAEYQRNLESSRETAIPLPYEWPRTVYSLSHVALPFPYSDPLYGGDAAETSPGIQIGNVILRGERGVLHVNPATLLRLRWNPFYGYMEERVLGFIGLSLPEEEVPLG